MQYTNNKVEVLHFAVLGLMLLVSACASYDARPLDPEASARAVQTRSLNNPDLLRFVAADLHRSTAPMHWDLAALTAVAVYERPDMKIAAGQVAVARAGQTTVAAWPNPVLTFSPTYNFSQNYQIESIAPSVTAVPTSPWTVGPVISQLLETGGKRHAAIAEAGAQAEAARALLAVAKWQLRSQVRTAFIGLWSANRRLELSRRNASLSDNYARAMAERYQSGMVSAADLTTAQLGQNQAALTLASDQRQEQLAVAALAAALGIPQTAVEGILIDWESLDRVEAPSGLAKLQQKALTTRPDVLAALARYEVAQAALQLAIARQYPDLNIGPGYLYDQSDNKFVLGISLPLPIFNQNQGPIAAARAARHVAAAEFDQAQTAVLGQIDTAVTDWRASHEEAQRARSLLHVAGDAEHREAVAFKTGATGRLRLIGAELAHGQAELGALSAAINERTALGQLEDALHHPVLEGA